MTRLLLRRAVSLIGALFLLGGCELTPAEQQALLNGIARGLEDASYDAAYGGQRGYGQNFGRAPAQRMQLCVERLGSRPRVSGVLVRDGQSLNQAIGRNAYRRDRVYVSVPSAYGRIMIAVPPYARLGIEPVFGIDEQGIRYRLTSARGCGRRRY